MNSLQVLNTNSFTDVIELIMVDGLKRKKKVMLFFNLNDDWRADEMAPTDVPGMFAGAIMEIFRKDRTAFAYKATAFTIQNNFIKKSMSFTPMVKVDDEFKECFIHDDGRVEFV